MADTGGKKPKDANSGATRSHAEDGGNVSEPTDRSTKKEMEEKQNKNGKLSPRVSTSAAKQSGSSKFIDARKAQFEQQQEHPRSPSAETHLENQTSNKAGIASKTDNLSGQSVCRTEENSQKFCVDERITVVEKEYKKETKSSETDQREDYKSEGTTGDSSLESGLKGEQMPGTTAGGSNYGATSSGNDRLYTKDLNNSTVFVGYSKVISINVKWLCGKTVKLQIDPSDSIYSVKIKLGNPEGICLMFEDKELVEDKPLFYYEIKDGDTLYALNRHESEIELNVKMITGDSFNVSVGLTDTVEKVMLKIEKKTGFSCENQRLIMDGKQLFKSKTLQSYGIVKDSTIHLVVKIENDADQAEGDSNSGLASNSTEVPETSDNPESKEKRDALENNPTEETDPNCSSQQDSTENGNDASQIEKLKPRIRKAPSPTPTSDVGSKYLHEQQGSGMLTHSTDINSQMKVKVWKTQHLIPDSKSPPKSRKKGDKLTTKVSDDGLDMNQEKGDTEIESENNISQTPETPDTEVVEKDKKDGMNVSKKDKDLDGDDNSDDDQQIQTNFDNDFSAGEDDPSSANLKAQSLQRDDDVLDDSGSHLSESNSVEIISEEDPEEQMRDGDNISIQSFNMTSMTQIPGDNNTELKPNTELCSTLGTGDEIVHGVNNAAKLPETHNAEGEKEIKHFVKFEEHKTIQQFSETPVFSIEKVGDGYLLYRQNYPPVVLPELEGASNVSVSKDMILIHNVPKYLIKIENEMVKVSELEVAKFEVKRSESNNTKRSGQDLSEEIQEQKGDEEGLEMKKVRKTTPDMQSVLNPSQENDTNSLNLDDTVADDNTGGSSGADVKKEESKPDVEDITCMLENMGIEDAPRQQQQSLEEAVCKDDKPPIPAPRSKNKENKLGNENDSQSSPTPPTRARRNSLNQPQEKKIQEPMSPKTEPMYKKVTFKVTYTLTGSSEKKEIEKEKKMGQLDYMKWKFATVDLKSLCDKLQSPAQNENYAFQANDGIMQVDIGSVSENSQIEKHIENIVDIVIEYSKNCVVKRVPFKHDTRGEDVKIAVQDIGVMNNGIYYVEIDEEEFCAIMICHGCIADQIVEKIKQKIRLLEAGRKPHTESITKPRVFKKKINEEFFQTWKQRFPLVQIRDKYMQADNTLLVALSGPKTEVDRALAMIEHDYPCNEFSFKDVTYSSEFSNIADMLREFTGSLQTDQDISVDINEEKEKIGICSTSVNTSTDLGTQMIKKCIKRKEIQKLEASQDFSSNFVEQIKEKLNEKHKSYIHLTLKEGTVMAYGLEEHLDSCFSDIKETINAHIKSRSKALKSPKDFVKLTNGNECVAEIIIENPLVYNYICKSEQFRLLENRDVHIQLKLPNTNVKGFVLSGLKEAVGRVKNDIKVIETSIEVQRINCEVQVDHKADFSEHINQVKESSNIVVYKKESKDEAIWFDSKKIQWIFSQGQTVQIAKRCISTCKKVTVRFEEEPAKSAKQGLISGGSDIVVLFPKWVGGCAKEKTKLSEMFNERLQACLDRSSHHIDVIVGKVSWKMPTFVKQLLVPLKELLQKRMTPCLSVCFCGSDEKICDDIYKACCGFFKGGLSTMPADERCVTVTITNGDLADTKADILVNTIDRMGTLDRGAISKSLLMKAGKKGQKLQAEIRKFKPLDSMKVYKTEAYLPDCKFIFHGWLESHLTDGTSEKKLKKFVLDCLKEAESCNCSSIAFPALGAGNLNYPLYEVKAAMFDAVEEFNMSCAGGTSLQDVKFVLFEYEAFQDFKAEQNKRDSKQPCAPSCHTYGNITFKAANGTIRDIKEDCILYLWERTAFYNAKRMPDQHVILKEIDEMDRRELFDKMLPQGRFTNEAVRTIRCRKLDNKDIIHAPYEDNPTGKQKAVTNLLKLAITKKKKYVGIYFDDANPFLKDGKFMTCLAAALSEVSSFAIYPIEVVVFVGNKFFNRAMTFFEENIQTASEGQAAKPVQPKTENVFMTVVGTKSNLDTAVDYLRKQKGVILMELHMLQEDQVDVIPEPASLDAPGEMFIERGPDPRDLQSGSTYVQNPELERIKALECFVEMKNIPRSETKASLTLKLTDFLQLAELGIILPNLVYQDGSDTAIVICANVEDAKKLENVQKSGFIFKGYDGKKSYRKVSWNFPKAKDLKQEDKDELKKIHVNVDEATGKIETLTTYQLKCAKAILAKYDKQEVTQTEEGINDNELVTIDNSIEIEASEDVWNIVSEICKKDIISVEKNFGPVKFENSKIVIPAHDSDFAKSEVQKLTSSIQTIKNKEITDIVIIQEKIEQSALPDFCKKVEESFGYPCCVWNQDKNKLFAYDDTYDKAMKVKHHFNITSGQIKQTGQNRRKNRGAAQIQSNDDTASGGITSDNRFANSFKNKSVEHSSKKTSLNQSDKEQCYKFGNTLVKIYRGDIVNLNVDCIVNAANKYLSHGGGVAAVIAKAAGYSLTKEGNDYIARNGDIPVGQAIATTAGKLNYKCVIHTVGPSWYDYESRSHDDVQRCKNDLFHAIYNCFTIAEGMELRSIAIPAISSALFGVPMDICVEQYARATLSYCKNAAEATALSEIHFIDIKPETVKRIQEAFQAKGTEGKPVEITRGADSESFGATSLKTTEGFGATSLKTTEGFGATSLKTTEGFGATSLETTVSKGLQKLPVPLAYEEGWKHNVFCFLESEKLNIFFLKDIFSVKANGIVVSVNEKGKCGAIGQALQNKIPKSYFSHFKSEFEKKINKSTKTGDVIVNGGYSCGYPVVLLVIYPYEARHKPQDERQADLEKAYKNVLLAARDKQIHTVVTTLFGIESNNDDEIKFAANCFLKSYLEYCKQKLIEMDSLQKEVTIVCQTEHAHSLVCEVFMKYVQDQKDKEMEKTSVSGNPQDDTKASVGELEDCVICLDGIKEPKRLDCGHTFCEECIEQHFKFAQKCPTCGHVCGKITGDQPDGTMDVYVNRHQQLSGYYSCDTIVITYTFQDGKQREDHPNPGKWYKGIQRRAYLPNNKEGRKIAKMLKVAFERKLVFTIGSSRTTGQEGVITWNDIHHKTDSRPNTQFGYPDPTYLERVKDELAAKGVTENDISGVTL